MPACIALENPLQSRAYLKNGRHINNGQLLDNFNLMLALGPKAKRKRSNIEVLDLTCSNWEEEKIILRPLRKACA
jgi:hypothetical protein